RAAGGGACRDATAGAAIMKVISPGFLGDAFRSRRHGAKEPRRIPGAGRRPHRGVGEEHPEPGAPPGEEGRRRRAREGRDDEGPAATAREDEFGSLRGLRRGMAELQVGDRPDAREPRVALRVRDAPHRRRLIPRRSRRRRGRHRREGPMIRKLSSGGYRLYSRKKDSKTGKRRNLGTFRTRAAAQKHERAV